MGGPPWSFSTSQFYAKRNDDSIYHFLSEAWGLGGVLVSDERQTGKSFKDRLPNEVILFLTNLDLTALQIRHHSIQGTRGSQKQAKARA
jgi:hypothetical protein